jgi:hypothetical protein
MSHSLQLFIYDANEIIIPHKNNFPFIRFDTPELAYDFIRNLKSHPDCSFGNPYFVINNMQLIPNDVRNLHMYKKHINNENDDGENEDGENEDGENDDGDIENDGDDDIMMDGCFSIYKNFDLFMDLVIDNNTNEAEGFKEYLKLIVEENNYYNSAEYIEDMREEYNDRLKYDLED